MENDLFYRLGNGIYRLRWWILIVSTIVFTLCIPLLPHIMKPFAATGFFNETAESTQANKILNTQLGYSYNRYIIMYTNPTALVTSPAIMTTIKQSLSSLTQFPNKHYILYPDTNPQQISQDKHTAMLL